MSFNDETRDTQSERTARLRSPHTSERELRGQDDLPLWGQESSRADFIEGHYGSSTAPGTTSTTGRGRAVSAADRAPSSRVGEQLTPVEPTAPQSTRHQTAEHERRFTDPQPLTPTSADAPATGGGRRRTDVVTFSDAANARDHITIGDTDAHTAP